MAPWARLLWRKNVWGRTRPSEGKNGRKRSLLVDARGIPLSLAVSGANRHDMNLLAATLDDIVCQRPEPRKGEPQHLCANAGYKGEPTGKAVLARNYRPHIKHAGAPGCPSCSEEESPKKTANSTPASSLNFESLPKIETSTISELSIILR